MAKKTDNKKAKAKTAPKKAKKVAKPAPKKAVKKTAPKKAAPKPAVKKKTEPKKVSKPVSTKTKTTAKKAEPKKEIKGKKLVGKPIDAVTKKGKAKKVEKVTSKKKGKSSDDEDEEDVDVKDDYEKTDEEDTTEPEIEGAELDEAGLVDLEGVSVPDEEDEDEVPEKRGRGRRKKNEGKSMGGSMEQYIRNRPVQIDITKQLVKNKNANDPKPFVNTKDNRTRYSDKELAEFKGIILQKLKEAQTDYDLLKQTMSNEDDNGTDDTSPSFKLLEDGSDVMSREDTAQLAARQEKYIVNLKNALVRIENKSYGICRVTGKLIPKERLRSVPHATLGIDAKLSQTA